MSTTLRSHHQKILQTDLEALSSGGDSKNVFNLEKMSTHLSEYKKALGRKDNWQFIAMLVINLVLFLSTLATTLTGTALLILTALGKQPLLPGIGCLIATACFVYVLKKAMTLDSKLGLARKEASKLAYQLQPLGNYSVAAFEKIAQKNIGVASFIEAVRAEGGYLRVCHYNSLEALCRGCTPQEVIQQDDDNFYQLRSGSDIFSLVSTGATLVIIVMIIVSVGYQYAEQHKGQTVPALDASVKTAL